MNLDHGKLAGPGRTTRMLEHAIARARDGKYTTVLAYNLGHANTLRASFLELLQSKSDDEKEIATLTSFISGGSLEMVTRSNNHESIRFYDYGTNEFRHDAGAQMEVLIDHYALEKHLVHVIRYLRAAANVRCPHQWMIDTARMMSTMGHRVYLV